MMTGQEVAVRNITLAAAIVNIILCLVLIPPLGAVGAALSHTASFSMTALLSQYVLKRRMNIYLHRSKGMTMENEGIKTRRVATCILCGTDGAPLYTNMRDRLFGAKGVWNILRCKNASCDLLWLDPQPVPEDTGLLYAGSYYTHQAPVLSTFKRLSRSLKMNRLGTLIWSAMYHQGEKTCSLL